MFNIVIQIVWFQNVLTQLDYCEFMVNFLRKNKCIYNNIIINIYLKTIYETFKNNNQLVELQC